MAQPSDAIPYVAVAVTAITLLRSWLKDRDGASTSKAKDAANESERLRAAEKWIEDQRRTLGEPAVVIENVERLERDSGDHVKEIRELREWRARVTPLLEWVERQRSQGRMSAVRVDTGGRGRRGGADGSGGG